VAPNTGGVVMYAHSGNAWLAAAEPGAFAAAVLDVFADEEERKRRVLEAKRTAEARTWPLAAQRYLRLYRELHARVCRAGDYSLDPAFFSTRTLSS